MLSRNKIGNVYLKHLFNDTSAFVQRICASVINLVKKEPPLTLDRNTSIGTKNIFTNLNWNIKWNTWRNIDLTKGFLLNVFTMQLPWFNFHALTRASRWFSRFDLGWGTCTMRETNTHFGKPLGTSNSRHYASIKYDYCYFTHSTVSYTTK